MKKHLFFFDVPHLQYMALGDASARILATLALIEKYHLDAYVIPHKNRTLTDLWKRAFGDRLIPNEKAIPESHRFATVSHPTSLDWSYGQNGWTIFEQIWWELGFFDTAKLWIVPPVLYPCDIHAKAVMIYPNEHTDGNRVFTSDWWRRHLQDIVKKGYAINVLGDFVAFDFHNEIPIRRFPATISGLEQCIAASSLAVGSSTGPTWTCLMSDIPQIVLNSHQSPSGGWFFDRCQRVLAKTIRVVSTLDAVLS